MSTLLYQSNYGSIYDDTYKAVYPEEAGGAIPANALRDPETGLPIRDPETGEYILVPS